MAFRTVSRQLPDEAWRAEVTGVPGLDPFPAPELLARRLVEVELHHCDLGAGYTPADWPDSFLVMRLPEPMRSQREERRTWSRTAPPLRPAPRDARPPQPRALVTPAATTPRRNNPPARGNPGRANPPSAQRPKPGGNGQGDSVGTRPVVARRMT